MVCQSWHQTMRTAHTLDLHKQELSSCHLCTNAPVAAAVALAAGSWMDSVVETPDVSWLNVHVCETLQPEPLHTVALLPAGKTHRRC